MELINFILHIDEYLNIFFNDYGSWVYVILFLIILVETGLVIMPFLPGDSLLFTAGALVAFTGTLNPVVLIGLMVCAAVLGDTLNYHIGHYMGPKVFKKEIKWINQQHLSNTQKFFAKHGGKTIVLARFLPFIRTFAPFVAGAGNMKYQHFLIYNMIGGFLWVSLFVMLGYFFGNQPIIKQNFAYIMWGIIIFSITPLLIGFLRNRKK